MTEDEAASAAPSAFDLMGGEPALRALVDRFYDLMELDTGHEVIRKLHPGSMDGSRDKLFWFLCGWMGGPQHYVERFGHPRLRARHLPFSIGVQERDQWLACMRQAMADVNVDPQLAGRLHESFFNTADWMRNRGA